MTHSSSTKAGSGRKSLVLEIESVNSFDTSIQHEQGESSGEEDGSNHELTIQDDHGLIILMKKVAISEFKAKCLSLLEEVEKTKKPLLVTKFGKPIAEVNPPSLNQKSRSWLGSMKDEIRFLGDIVSPVFDERDWKEPGE